MDAAAHQAEVAAFRARRDARYRSEDGWLTLVERIPLEAGENRTAVGVLVVEPGGGVRLRPAPGTTRAGQALAGEVAVAIEEEAHPADRFELAGRRYDVTRRGDALSLRVRDPQAPARLAFTAMPTYPVDLRWRVVAPLERIDPPRRDLIGNTDGTSSEETCLGRVAFELEGTACALLVYAEASTGRLFTPFRDRTSAVETYGGGRFLYPTEPRPGELVLDFNMAFNPPCAMNSLVICPLPPRENQLPVAVRAGERAPA